MRLTTPDQPRRQHHQLTGSVQTVLIVLVAFLAGAAVTVWWLRAPAKQPAPVQTGVELSAASKGVLEHLQNPVQLRFYSLLDPNVPPTLREFSARVERLLEAYQENANGKLAITLSDSQTNSNPNAAIADGIQGFDLDKGEGCYLGVAMESAGRKQVLPRLSPEWEPALEADLSRAIRRLAEARSEQTPAGARASNAEAIEQVKQAVPDLDTMSLEDATRLVREASLKEFTATVTNMQAQVQEAETRLRQALNGGSPADQQTAMRQLQEVQTAQAQKLKEIAARSQAQVDALKQLKGGGK